MAEYKQGDPTGGGGDGVPEWVKFRVANADSGDFTTPGWDDNAPSQYLSGSEDATGITLTMRNRTVVTSKPETSFGWFFDPTTLFPGIDIDDRDFSYVFRVSIVTAFPQGSLAWMSAGVVDRGGDIQNAAARYIDGKLQQGSGQMSHRTAVRATQESTLTALETIPGHWIWERYRDQLGRFNQHNVDANGDIFGNPGTGRNEPGSLTGGLKFFIAGGIENQADTDNRTGKYELEVARIPLWPAGSIG